MEIIEQKIQQMVEAALTGHQVDLENLTAEEKSLFDNLLRAAQNASDLGVITQFNKLNKITGQYPVSLYF